MYPNMNDVTPDDCPHSSHNLHSSHSSHRDTLEKVGDATCIGPGNVVPPGRSSKRHLSSLRYLADPIPHEHVHVPQV